MKPVEITGPFKTWYRWKTLDFAYPDPHAKAQAMTNDDLIPENNLPLGKFKKFNYTRKSLFKNKVPLNNKFLENSVKTPISL